MDIVGELVAQGWDLQMFTLHASTFSDFANNILMNRRIEVWRASIIVTTLCQPRTTDVCSLLAYTYCHSRSNNMSSLGKRIIPWVAASIWHSRSTSCSASSRNTSRSIRPRRTSYWIESRTIPYWEESRTIPYWEESRTIPYWEESRTIPYWEESRKESRKESYWEESYWIGSSNTVPSACAKCVIDIYWDKSYSW